MLVLIALMVLFLGQPALAGDFFEDPCKEDLSKVVNHDVDRFESYPDLFPGQPNLVAKRLGVSHALCIDEVIKLAQKVDMSRMPMARKYFIADLEWAQNLFKSDMSKIYRQAHNLKVVGSNPTPATKFSLFYKGL